MPGELLRLAPRVRGRVGIDRSPIDVTTEESARLLRVRLARPALAARAARRGDRGGPARSAPARARRLRRAAPGRAGRRDGRTRSPSSSRPPCSATSTPGARESTRARACGSRRAASVRLQSPPRASTSLQLGPGGRARGSSPRSTSTATGWNGSDDHFARQRQAQARPEAPRATVREETRACSSARARISSRPRSRRDRARRACSSRGDVARRAARRRSRRSRTRRA